MTAAAWKEAGFSADAAETGWNCAGQKIRIISVNEKTC
jgi:hypothetical protein